MTTNTPPPLPKFIQNVHPDAVSLTPPQTELEHPYGFQADDGKWYLFEYTIVLKATENDKVYEFVAMSSYDLFTALRDPNSKHAARLLAHGCILFDTVLVPLNDNVLRISRTAIPISVR